MPFLSVYVDDRDLATLRRASAALGRSIEDLADAAISEAACGAERSWPAPKPKRRNVSLSPGKEGVG